MLIPLPENQQQGMDEKHSPDKQWAVNVLKLLNLIPQLFEKYNPEKAEMKTFTNEQFKKIRTLDLSTGKKGIMIRFFRIDKDKQLQIQQKKKIDQKKNNERKIQRKKESLKKVEKEIKPIGQNIKHLKQSFIN